MKYFNQVKAVFAGLLLSGTVIPVASAEDIEIYTTLPAGASTPNPNIMFVVDTSAVMADESRIKPFYDPSISYAPPTYPLEAGKTACISTAIYTMTKKEEATSGISEPDCADENYFNVSALLCDHATVAWSYAGVRDPSGPGPLNIVGTYADQLARYDAINNRWLEMSDVTAVSERDYKVECLLDSGLNGDGTGGAKYIIDGGPYTSTAPANPEVPHTVWAGGAGNKQLYSGNYLNYKNWEPVDLPGDPSDQLVSMSYIDQVKGAVNVMVTTNTQIDIGLMRFDKMSSNGNSGNSEGGPVLYPIRDVGASRNDFNSRLATLDADGKAPMSEAYYEALLYYGGKAADYSLTSSPGNSITSSTISGDNYISPISSTCDKNYIVVLSAGIPTLDVVNATRQAVLPDFTGSCSTTVETVQIAGTGASTRDGLNATDNCLDELAAWAATEDIATTNALAHEGEQYVYTHTIGLGLVTDAPTDAPTNTGVSAVDDANALANAANATANANALAARSLLSSTARNGKGQFFQAKDQSDLVDIFDNITKGLLEVNSTFSSPAVSVNAYNRSTHLEDLYFTLFKPAAGNHWEGNLKKYKLKFDADRLPFIADKTGAAAIAPDTGFFKDSARSYWLPDADLADGKEVAKGGAAERLTASRNVYTYTGGYTGIAPSVSNQLSAAANVISKKTDVTISTDPTILTDALLGIETETANSTEIIPGKTYRETLTNWAAGRDALSAFGDVDTYIDARPQMGDPLHSEPALVQYGQTTTTTAGITTTTADLVAYVATNDGYLHAIDVDTGEELFSFIPQELLPNLKIAMEDTGGDKLYGLDGNVVAWIHDDDGDNEITPGGNDHAYIYVGMRRGGNNIYALNVTNRNDPRLMWVIKGGEGDYEQLGQTWSTINVEKVKNGSDPETVLIFGGGYDTSHDTLSARPVTPDPAELGATVYIASATTGARLWSAGSDGANTSDMKYSIPARVKPLDISADGFIDRLYVADTGGQIFRFDINNTNGNSLATSITGARIADLSGADIAGARHFYYPPDVALIDAPGGAYHAVVINSGYRAHPLNESIHDRIYMIKDKNTGLLTANDQYKYDVDNSTDPAVRVLGALTEGDLKDVTTNMAGGEGITGTDETAKNNELDAIGNKEGWYINLSDEDDSDAWIGEKGLGEPLIIEGVAILTTYTPNAAPAAANSCTPALGLGKIFYLDILDATAAFPSVADVRSERHTELIRPGIPSSPGAMIPEGGEATICVGTECGRADFGLGIRKTYWYEVN